MPSPVKQIDAASYDMGSRRIKNILFGKRNPGVYMQIVCIAGLIAFAWFFFWNFANLLALRMMNTLPKAAHIKQAFIRLGESYEIHNIIEVYFRMVVAGLSGSTLLLAGILLMWREYRWAAGLYILGLLVCVLSPIGFIGFRYVTQEQYIPEYVVPVVLIVMALFILFGNKKSTAENTDTEEFQPIDKTADDTEELTEDQGLS